MSAKIRIKMLTSISGSEYTAKVGEVIEVEGEEARRLIAKGYAESVRGRKPKAGGEIETATTRR